MDSGFRLDHFRVLDEFGKQKWVKTPEQVEAYKVLQEAYLATARWSRALQERMFPMGRTYTRKAPLNRGTWFWDYNWSRIWPSADAPEQLCYTVGIDRDGTFNIKIDTAGADEPWRHRYLALLEDDYGRTPFVSLLPAARGVSMSLEELLDWSEASIRNFEIGYWEVARWIGLSTKSLQRLRDQSTIRRWFEVWRNAMFEGAVASGSIQWLPDCTLVAKACLQTGGRLRCQLGDDPTGAHWTVEINEPSVSSDWNALSAIAIDGDGRHHLIRQGTLRPNVPGGETIGADRFADRAGIREIGVNDVGKAAARSWYLVASLDADPFEIRRRTANFVEACARVRGWNAAPQPPFPDGYDMSEESGDSYIMSAKGPVEEKEIRRRQGLVWLKLKEVLAPHNIVVCKTPRHRRGFQVDALIGPDGDMRLLVEIKTGISSSDIHGGVGQLHIYPKLMPSAAGLKPVLLLPRERTDDVLDAIRELGITPHFYDLGDGTKDGITFRPAFLAECGIQ